MSRTIKERLSRATQERVSDLETRIVSLTSQFSEALKSANDWKEKYDMLRMENAKLSGSMVRLEAEKSEQERKFVSERERLEKEIDALMRNNETLCEAFDALGDIIKKS